MLPIVHKQLSKNEFATALKRGQGRAFLYVKQFGLKDVADIVLKSCLKTQVYDRQCEPGRAPWLYSMFKDTEEYARFSSAICSALESETGHYALEQLCELSALMAKDGDDAPGVALRARVLGQPFGNGDTFGCHELVVLDGIAAVVELARRFGNLLIADPEEMLPTLGDLTYELDIRPQAETRLKELAETDSAIQAYLDKEHSEATHNQNTPKLTKEQRQEQTRERIRKEYPLENVLGDASAGVGDFPGRYMRFGDYARREDLRTSGLKIKKQNILKIKAWGF